VLLELDGVRLLTDPVLRSRMLHLRRSGRVDMDTVRHVDAALVSHAHWDHLDLRSLDRLAGKPQFVVPRGMGATLRRRGLANVEEVDVGDVVEIGAVTVTATFADHDGRRGPLAPRSPSLGYVVTGTQRVYFAGDTDLFDEMGELGQLDAALLPVAGWGPRLPPGHLDPRRAAEALGLLRPRVAIPIHWGTYSVISLRRRDAARDRVPAEEFERLAHELAPEVDIHVLAHGETLVLD
jgi:L-ascorbate metabolism protein UlaG (beta-lactamase superfamily)